MTEQPNIFIKNVWDYDPKDWPVIVFGKEDKRQELLSKSKEGDLVLLRASNNGSPPAEKKNKLLALAEFDRTRPVLSEKVLKPEILEVRDYQDSYGKFKWNFAIFIKRILLFTEMPDASSFLENMHEYNRLSESGSSAIQLTDSDRDKILEIKHQLKPENLVNPYIKEEKTTSYFSASTHPSIGKYPDNNYRKRPAQTYALRFGNRNIWKIGFTTIEQNERISQLNTNIPHEATGEKWEKYIDEQWDTAVKAFEMEQELFFILRNKRTHGEIVECTEEELNNAWKEAIEKLK